jgi:transposase
MLFKLRGMSVQNVTINQSPINLRQQAHYWRTQHARALKREGAWKEKALQREALAKEQAAKIAEQGQQIEVLKARIAWLQQQVFGRKGEQSADAGANTGDDEQNTDGLPAPAAENGRKRGKQPGTKGYGRKGRVSLPTEEVSIDLPKHEQRCPVCAKAFAPFPGTEDSDEIHWEVRVVRRVYKRARWVPTCNCGAVPGIVTAPVPAKLILKGMFSTGFWVRLLIEKFLFQRPLYRIIQGLALEGLDVSQGTLTGGLRRIGALVQPLYAAILERSRSASRWQMDETRWMVFVEVKGKVGHRWWLWVVVTCDACCYLLEPTRSADVPRNHLGEEAEGILNADRYSAYKALIKVLVAFCWSHIRRDFIRVGKGYKRLSQWAGEWVQSINELFRQNRLRLQQPRNSEGFATQDQQLRKAIDTMDKTLEEQLADDSLHPAQQKAMQSLRNHWQGATPFVDHPEVPMDNNESERRLRNPVIGRKNYYGSGSLWSGTLTAMMFTIFQTLLLNHIDPQKFLLAYFGAGAQNRGRVPENVNEFLPWNLAEEQKVLWRYPKQPP